MLLTADVEERRQNTVDRGRTTEGRGQRAEGRGQRTDGSGQTADDPSEIRSAVPSGPQLNRLRIQRGKNFTPVRYSYLRGPAGAGSPLCFDKQMADGRAQRAERRGPAFAKATARPRRGGISALLRQADGG